MSRPSFAFHTFVFKAHSLTGKQNKETFVCRARAKVHINMRLVTWIGLLASLVVAFPGPDFDVEARGVMTVDLDAYPDSVVKGQCNECCPTTIRTVITKVT